MARAGSLLFITLAWLGCSAEGGDLKNGNSQFQTGNGGNGTTGSGGNGGGGARKDGGTLLQYFPDALGFAGNGGPNTNGETPCAVQKVNLDRQPPELLLVLDRSGSMRRDANGNVGTPDKWKETTDALNEAIMSTQTGILWGLKLFPFPPSTQPFASCAPNTTCQTDPVQCEANRPPNVDPALNSHMAIMKVITDNAPPRDVGTTPTRDAMTSAVDYLKNRTTMAPKYVVLATDGEPNDCGGRSANEVRSPTANPPQAIAAVKASADAGFPVFVVGIALSGATLNTLNSMADAGGRPQMGAATHFYSVRSKQDLLTALATITGQIATCTFTLNMPPPDPSNVAVDVGDVRVPQDNANGWSYGAGMRTIVLNGSSCESLKSGKSKEANISFGCPGMPIP